MSVLVDTELERVRAALDGLLEAWLPGRRWFAGKDTGTPAVTTRLLERVLPGDPALLVAVFDTGADGPYQALIGMRRGPAPVPSEAVIGRTTAPGGPALTLYEATQEPELMTRLLERFGADEQGPVRFERLPGSELPFGVPGVASTAEQSNTSVAFADRAMFKVLRRPVPGTSPELELLGALQRAGSVPSAAPLAQVRTTGESPVGAFTLGIVQEFVRSRGDGWAAATGQARACLAAGRGTEAPLGGFAEESYALGLATARVHTALAEQLGSRPLTGPESAALLDLLGERLAEGLRSVPQLSPYAAGLWELHEELRTSVLGGRAPLVQRIHGDLHLGQVLRTEQGWVLIDFEGEPGHSPQERRRPQPALRDVAAMLRSFDYAAHHALTEVLDRPPAETPPDDPHAARLARRATAWAVHNRQAYCAGYAAGGGQDPRRDPLLVRSFEADKAVYEAVYEAHNRPEWLPIPLLAVRRLTEEIQQQN
ncbi:maltokinase N-terminal cap-like domain-containing protein [Streptomyces sp. BK340]|uniref:maltokinase N-terminal cap-like domain-containing protein n=1 Tax=Streptomyces sp. BK340 TaxID=2572903 RepID=UPI0011A23FED|nr:maltokinase [Streptomyces sp. BK340]TVZ80464.1 maltokinase [Streptomyces sp. BK340]